MIITRETEVFEDQEMEVVSFGGERWLRGPQIAGALGFKNPSKAVSDIYSRNRSEFDDQTTIVIELPTNSGRQLVRLYNARGAALIAMKAQTPKGEVFRRWVLDVLEGKAEIDAGPVRLATGLSPTALGLMRQLFLGAKGNTQLVRLRVAGLKVAEIAKLQDVSPGFVSKKLRVAEELGLVEADPRADAIRQSEPFRKLVEWKRINQDKQNAKRLAARAPAMEAGHADA